MNLLSNVGLRMGGSNRCSSSNAHSISDIIIRILKRLPEDCPCVRLDKPRKPSPSILRDSYLVAALSYFKFHIGRVFPITQDTPGKIASASPVGRHFPSTRQINPHKNPHPSYAIIYPRTPKQRVKIVPQCLEFLEYFFRDGVVICVVSQCGNREQGK